MIYDYTTSIILLGNRCVGKTTFINNILNKSITNTPTIGVDFYKLGFNYNNKQYKLRIWDSGCGLTYKNILSDYLKNSLIYVIIETTLNIDFIYNICNILLNYDKIINIIIIYNKFDSNNTSVFNENIIKNKYSKFNFNFIYISIINKSDCLYTLNLIKNITINHFNSIDNISNTNTNTYTNINTDTKSTDYRDYKCCSIS